jgi:hypothetical protein
MILLPLAVFAGDCENPLDKTYEWDGITVTFKAGYSGDTICQIDFEGEPSQFFLYNWDPTRCRATLETDPPIYLLFDDGWFDLSTIPYRFATIGTCD